MVRLAYAALSRNVLCHAVLCGVQEFVAQGGLAGEAAAQHAARAPRIPGHPRI